MSKIINTVPSKDPDSTLDYSLDWSEWLDGDTISSVAWVVPAGLVLELQSHTATVATAWISGGTAGTDHVVECQITTAAGRADVPRSIRIPCRE